MPTYCLLDNTAKRQDGTSPWTERFTDEFKGERLAPGMMVWFRPARTIYDPDKTQPRLQVGVFLGYRLNDDHKWNGEYKVADLDSFVGLDLDERASPSGVRIPTHHTKTIRIPGGQGAAWRFHLKAKYDLVNTTLEGREGAKTADHASIEQPDDAPPEPDAD